MNVSLSRSASQNESGTPHQSPHIAGFDAVVISSDVAVEHRNCLVRVSNLEDAQSDHAKET